MNNEQFVASLTSEQNAALLAFRDSLLQMYNATASDNAASHAEELLSKQTEIDALKAEVEAANSSQATLLSECRALTQEVASNQQTINQQQSELSAALARIAELENPPSVAWRLAPNDFVKRFTHEELIATQLSTDPIVILGRTDIQTIITYIDLKDPQTAMYVGRLVQLGILTEQRATEIMAH